MSGFSVTTQFEIGDTVPFLGDDLYILEIIIYHLTIESHKIIYVYDVTEKDGRKYRRQITEMQILNARGFKKL